MTDPQDTAQAIHARILELLDSGPVPREELPAAVAVSPDEREAVNGFEQMVKRVAGEMLSKGEIALNEGVSPPEYHLPEDTETEST